MRYLWGLAVLSSLAACTALLGDDFEITGSAGTGGTQSGTATAATPTTGGGGSGGVGTAGNPTTGGGGMGGQGGEPIVVPDLDCQWVLPMHREIFSTEGQSLNYFSTQVHGLRLGVDAMRIFLEGSGANRTIDTYRVGPTIPAGSFSSEPGETLYDTFRFTFGETVALISEDDANFDPVLRLMRTDDNGDFSFTTQLTEPLGMALPNYSPSSSINAVGTVVPSGIDPDLDVAFSFRQADNMYGLAYFRKDMSSGSTQQPVVIASDNMDATALIPRDIVHYDGDAYITTGLFDDPVLMWRVNDQTMGEVTPTMIGPPDNTVLMAEAVDTRFNVASFGIGPPVRMKAGRIALSQLEMLDLDAINVVGEYPTESDLPVNVSGYRWIGDLAVMMGAPATNDTQFRYWFFDAEGVERGFKVMPFTHMLDPNITRQDIRNVFFAPADLDVDKNGGRIHVAWSEEQSRAGNFFDVIYYDQLECVVQ